MPRRPHVESLACSALIDLLEETPLQEVRVTDLVRRAGVSRSAFYVHFGSVYAVAQRVEDDFVDGLLDERLLSRRLDSERIPALEERLAHVSRQLPAVCVLMGENGDPSFRERLLGRVSRFVSTYAPAGSYADGELEAMSSYFAGGLISFFGWWEAHPESLTKKEAADLLARLAAPVIDLLESADRRDARLATRGARPGAPSPQ